LSPGDDDAGRRIDLDQSELEAIRERANLHAAFEAAGTGNEIMVRLVRHSREETGSNR
jgi:hypothetical protein